ncbi:MAG: alpha/beta hydrolase [Ktedonobacteraceae bacterium]|nr:alpha/beta hydrolase [Ktedonobacteraceae bacterium]
MVFVDVQEIWLKIDGIRTHCLTGGNSGSPVLLLHGGGIDSALLSWGELITSLSTEYRVFAPDLPGYGESDKPDIAYTTDFYTAFVTHLLDALHLERVSLVGLSMGGAIALNLALHNADRVEKLVLVDSYGIIDAQVWPRWLYVLIYLYVHHCSFLNELTYRLMHINPGLVRCSLLAAGVIHSTQRISQELINQIYQHAQIPGRGKAFTSWQQSEIQWHGLHTTLIDRLYEIRTPTLLINGEKDHTIPLAYVQKAHKLIADSQLYVIRDCGHWPQREKPDEFNRIVAEFLR